MWRMLPTNINPADFAAAKQENASAKGGKLAGPSPPPPPQLLLQSPTTACLPTRLSCKSVRLCRQADSYCGTRSPVARGPTRHGVNVESRFPGKTHVARGKPRRHGAPRDGTASRRIVNSLALCPLGHVRPSKTRRRSLEAQRHWLPLRWAGNRTRLQAALGIDRSPMSDCLQEDAWGEAIVLTALAPFVLVGQRGSGLSK